LNNISLQNSHQLLNEFLGFIREQVFLRGVFERSDANEINKRKFFKDKKAAKKRKTKGK